MTYFTATELAGIQSDPVNKIGIVYGSNRARFLIDLGRNFSWLSEDHLSLIFCGLVAFDMKPYVNSVATSLTDLLAAPGLDCDNYAMLAWRLNVLLNPVPAGSFQPAFVGLNGGAVGNHCQIMVGGGSTALIDPTYGLFAAGFGYDWIMAGKPVSPDYIADFRAFKAGTNWPVTSSAQTTYDALRKGSYKPSDGLYYHRTIEGLIAGRLSSPQADVLLPAA